MGHGVLGHLMSPTRGVRKPCRRAAPAAGLARDCPRCASGLRDCRGRLAGVPSPSAAGWGPSGGRAARTGAPSPSAAVLVPSGGRAALMSLPLARHGRAAASASASVWSPVAENTRKNAQESTPVAGNPCHCRVSFVSIHCRFFSARCQRQTAWQNPRRLGARDTHPWSLASRPRAAVHNDQPFHLPTHLCMPVPAAPSELRQALAKLTPFFWRAFVFAIIGGLLVLGPTVYMFEVYDRVVNSRNELTLAMLTLIVLLAIVVMELLEWARAETLREAGAALDQALAPRIFNAIHVAHLKQGAALGVQPMVDLRVVRDFFHGPALGAAMEAPVALILLILLFVIHPLLGWVALAGAVLQP